MSTSITTTVGVHIADTATTAHIVDGVTLAGDIQAFTALFIPSVFQDIILTTDMVMDTVTAIIMAMDIRLITVIIMVTITAIIIMVIIIATTEMSLILKED